MICYICHSEAVGQCKTCGKFYCPQHGDEYCVRCRDVVPGKKTLDDLDDLPGPQEDGPFCYICRGAIAGACPLCGKLYCSKHGGMGPSNSVRRRGLCDPCYERVRARASVGFAALLAWFLILFFIVLWAIPSQTRPPQPVAPQPPQPVIVPFNPTFQGKPAVIPAEPSSRPWPPP